MELTNNHLKTSVETAKENLQTRLEMLASKRVACVASCSAHML